MPLQAQNLWPFAPEKFATVFRYQYVISRERHEIPGFQYFSGPEWNLAIGRDLPVCELLDRDGAHLGYILGIAVGPEALLADGTNQLPFSREATNFWSLFEAWLTELAGRYAIMLSAHGKTRFYVDPVGMIGAVYNAQAQILAASPLMAITDPVKPNRKFDYDIIRDRGGKLSLFHTADERVRRLNPNFYLDLEDFVEHRHWPRNERFSLGAHEVLPAYDEMVSRLSFNIAEITRAYPASVPVSGGQDSRIVLACCQENADSRTRYYTHINNYATRRDAAIGAALCSRLGLEHEIHDRRNSKIQKNLAEEFQASWNLSFGVESAMPMEYRNGVILNLPEKDVVLRGHQTDILRAVYVFRPKKRWGDASWQLKRMLIVPREMFNSDLVERFSDDFFRWQKTLPPNAMEKAADFMFIEVYYNSTIGASFPALWRNFYMSPFNSRKLISLALSFPEGRRRRSEPVFDVIEHACPALSGIPFDFELHADLSYLDDPSYCQRITEGRIGETRSRLEEFARAAENSG